MPSLFSGLSTPSWESPDDFLNSSVARGEKLAGNFLEGFRQARQDALQAPMRAMALQRAQDEHQDQLLNIAKDKNLMETKQQMTAGEAVLSQKVAEIAKAGDWNNPAARSAIFDTVAKYPATANSPLLKETMGWMQASDKATEAAEHQKNLLKVAEDKAESERIRADAYKTKSELGTTTEQTLNLAEKAEADAGAARASGNNSEYERLIKRANTYRDSINTHGEETISTGFDDQGRPIFNVSKGGRTAAGGSTVATASMSQRKLLKYENATQLINGLQKSLRPMDVGVAGVAGEYIGDRLGAQVPGFEGVFSKQRVDNRTVMGAIRETLMREISDDTRFSNRDREEISSLLPSTGAFESFQAAQAKLNKVREIITDRARVYSERTGEAVPDFARTTEEIASEYKRKKAALEKAISIGTLDAADGAKQIEAEFKRSKDALMRFH